MLPPPAEIAARDAHRLARVLAEVGGATAPVGQGVMACDDLGSWADFAAAIAVSAPPSPEELDRLVAFYESRGRRPRVHLTPYEHPALLAGLADRGFVLYDMETVLVAPCVARPAPPVPDGLRLVPVDPADPASVARFVLAQGLGFHEGRAAPPAMDRITARVATHPRARLWILEVDGQLAGSGGLETWQDSAVLIAGAVLPAFRRRGLQTALLHHRLAAAAELGCRYALVGSAPGGPTERNALRLGFAPAYAQLAMERRSSS